MMAAIGASRNTSTQAHKNQYSGFQGNLKGFTAFYPMERARPPESLWAMA
jgi:hypothetical protein